VTLRFMAVVLALVAAAPAHAHPEDEVQGPSVIDCDHPPETMIKTLPAAFEGIGRLACSASGQSIVAHPDWSWRFPASIFVRPSIPAFTPAQSQTIVGARHFTGFEEADVSAAEAQALHRRFSQTVSTYNQSEPPQILKKLLAKNDLGHQFEIYFGLKSKRDGWVVLCDPDCAPEYVFVVEKLTD
jgi:hypothetical protein